MARSRSVSRVEGAGLEGGLSSLLNARPSSTEAAASIRQSFWQAVEGQARGHPRRPGGFHDLIEELVAAHDREVAELWAALSLTGGPRPPQDAPPRRSTKRGNDPPLDVLGLPKAEAPTPQQQPREPPKQQQQPTHEPPPAESEGLAVRLQAQECGPVLKLGAEREGSMLGYGSGRLAHSQSAAIARARRTETREVAIEGTPVIVDVGPATSMSSTPSEELTMLGKANLTLRSCWSMAVDNHDITRINNVAAAHIKGAMFSPEVLPPGSFDEPVASRLHVFFQMFVMEPTGAFCMHWNGLGVLAVAYEAIMLPLQLLSPPNTDFATVMSVVTAAFWSIDLVLSFCKAYFEGGTLINDIWNVARKYALTWFLPDCSIVTVDWISIFMEGWQGLDDVKRTSRALRCVRFIRFIRLLRIVRAARFFAEVWNMSGTVAQSQMSVLGSIVFLAFLTHYVACFWYAVSHDTWDDSYQDSNLAFKYLLCVHWTLTQLGVGASQIQPETESEFVFTIFLLFLSIIIFSSLVSVIANAIEQIRSKRQQDRDHFHVYHKFCNQHNLTNDLKCRMQAYIEHVYYSRYRYLCMSDVDLLNLLSAPLLQELQLQIWLPHVAAQPMLQWLSKKFHMVMQILCSMAMDSMQLARGDAVFQPGLLAEKMIFIVGGELQYTRASNNSTELLGQGAWAAEGALWIDKWVTLGLLRSSTVSEILQLNGLQFSSIISLHPPAFWDVKSYAERFLAYVNGLSAKEISDIMESPMVGGGTTSSVRESKAPTRSSARDHFIVKVIKGWHRKNVALSVFDDE